MFKVQVLGKSTDMGIFIMDSHKRHIFFAIFHSIQTKITKKIRNFNDLSRVLAKMTTTYLKYFEYAKNGSKKFSIWSPWRIEQIFVMLTILHCSVSYSFFFSRTL